MAGLGSPEAFAAWQLAWELKDGVPDNISEGFYRFNPPDFANFVRMARGSLGEVRNQLKHAHAKKYVSDSEFEDLLRLCSRAIGAATRLRLYLLTLPRHFDPRNVQR